MENTTTKTRIENVRRVQRELDRAAWLSDDDAAYTVTARPRAEIAIDDAARGAALSSAWCVIAYVCSAVAVVEAVWW